MNVRKDGNVLWISEDSFYEPPHIPTVAQRKRARVNWAIAVVAALTLVGLGLSGANKLQRFL